MQFSGVYVLWEEPLVFSCFGDHDRSRFLRLKPRASILSFPAWLLHFMRNSLDEERLLGKLRLPGGFVSQNAYVNEHIFRPTSAAKQYAAVYTAQMKPFKRLHLAAHLRSLYVVTYGDVRTLAGENDLHRFVPELSFADFNRQWISFEQVNDIYNRANVGLALSSVEGAMLAAVEYMLAGLPVVSTPCRGGRELYFDQRFVAIVAPTREAVAAGVAQLTMRQVDPMLVREATLNRVNEQRLALCRYVQGVIKGEGGRVPDVDKLFERIFGSPQGTAACFVHLRDFPSKGWL
jgi:glycosyltransferase involved in cell wall biosynthesis